MGDVASGKGVLEVEDKEKWVVALRVRCARASSREMRPKFGDAARSDQPGGSVGAMSGDEMMLVDSAGAPIGSGAEISFPWKVEARIRGLWDGDMEDEEESGVKVDPVTDRVKDGVVERDSVVTVTLDSLRATLGIRNTERLAAGVAEGSSEYEKTSSGFAYGCISSE
jgi:hypothetical protein